MSWKSAAVWIGLFALLALAGTELFAHDGEPRRRPSAGTTLRAEVVRVVDGDTIAVRYRSGPSHARGDTAVVRYIGIDTPETVKPGAPVQCFGKAASSHNQRLVAGKPVQLRVGREPFDRYGRLLAYVRLATRARTFVNAELVAGGYARTLAIPPNTQFAAQFARLERRARRQRAGLWRACPAG
jgi:micrococcal nuclease